MSSIVIGGHWPLLAAIVRSCLLKFYLSPADCSCLQPSSIYSHQQFWLPSAVVRSPGLDPLSTVLIAVCSHLYQ